MAKVKKILKYALIAIAVLFAAFLLFLADRLLSVTLLSCQDKDF